jgi:DNA polymerase-3 subunit gamma/tau
VSYKQEQRFHLELGLLKMVHAQRLLPLEQLLSGVNLTEAAAPAASQSTAGRSTAGQNPAGQRPAGPPPSFASRPAGVPPMGGGSSPFGQPATKPSPLEADKARRGREEMSSGAETAAAPSVVLPNVSPSISTNKPMSIGSQPIPQAFGARPAAMMPPVSASSMPFDDGSALAVAPREEIARAAADAGPKVVVSADSNATSNAASNANPSAGLDVDAIRGAVLEAMETGGSQMLVHALEEGEWSGEGNLVSVQVGMSDAMIGISYTREQEKLSGQAASRVAGRTVKVRLVGGTTTTAQAKPRTPGAGIEAGSGSIKTRAAEEPVVKRMMEKFGAEIRMVMDRSER